MNPVLIDTDDFLRATALPTDHALNTDRTAAVATGFFYREDMDAAPRAVKLILLGQGGVAALANYDGDPFWVGWAPLPRRRPSE